MQRGDFSASTCLDFSPVSFAFEDMQSNHIVGAQLATAKAIPPYESQVAKGPSWLAKRYSVIQFASILADACRHNNHLFVRLSNCCDVLVGP